MATDIAKFPKADEGVFDDVPPNGGNSTTKDPVLL